MVKDVNPGTGSGLQTTAMAGVGSTLFFRANDGSSGDELWKTDGTDAGTVRVKDINPGTGGSYPLYFSVMGGSLYFTAGDGTHGTELWKSDGTDAGTVMVKDLSPGVAGGAGSATGVYHNALYFEGNDGTGSALWKTDGTDAGTVKVSTAFAPSEFIVFADKLFFTAISLGSDRELWSTDGTTAGTAVVKDVNPGSNGSYPQEKTIVGNQLYFTADDGTHGRELWKTDGTGAGTALVRDINPGTATSAQPNSGGWLYLAAARGTLFFGATDGTTGSELWRITTTLPDFAPSAPRDAYSTSEDAQLSVAAPGVLANDTDFDGDRLSLGPATSPAHGTLTFNPDGSFVYTPQPNFNGADNFTYTVMDGRGGATQGTVLITVASVNDVPVAVGEAYSTNEDTPLTVATPGLLRNDSDADGDPLTATVAAAPAHGSVALNPDGSFTYTPAANFNGTDSFVYTASDGHGGNANATVTIAVAAVNDAPVAANDSYHSGMFGVGVGAPGVLGNDYDVDGDPMTAALARPPTNGTVSFNADGSFTYNPNFLFGGIDTFTYTVSDGHGGTATGTVTIDVGLL
jgi:ELWxxDGT repeat protein/VCBS repeat-containing protein